MLTSQRPQISSLASILPGRPEKVARSALQKVRALGVDVRLSTRVLNTKQLEDGRTELALDGPGAADSGDDARMVTDLHIPAYGETPNSSYMPRDFLDKKGHILTGDFLDVPGADGVYAVGVKGRGADGVACGVALKIEDGSARARPGVTLGILSEMGWMSAAASRKLGAFAAPAIRNAAGAVVGSVDAELPIIRGDDPQ